MKLLLVFYLGVAVVFAGFAGLAWVVYDREIALERVKQEAAHERLMFEAARTNAWAINATVWVEAIAEAFKPAREKLERLEKHD